MKNSVIAIPYFVITMIVYTLSPIFFEMNDNAYGEGVNLVVSDQNAKTLTYSEQQEEQEQPQIQQLEKKCKSPCSDSSKMCIAMCA